MELQTEANLVFMKDQGWFYHVDPMRVLDLVTLRLQVLERLIRWVLYKKHKLLEEKDKMVKCWIL